MIDTRIWLKLILDVLPALYGVALFDYILAFATDEKVVHRLARPLLLTAVAADSLYLLGFTLFFEHIPMVTVYQAFGAVAFAVAAIYLWVEGKTGNIYTGPFILVLVFVFQVLSTLFPRLDPEVPEILRSQIFSFHVSAAVLGYSAFVVAAVYGLLYLLLYHQVKDKTFGLVFRRLPSLDILDRMNFYAATVGFAFLTLAIILGAIWSTHLFGKVVADPKVLVAAGTWLLYGLAIGGRRLVSWRGPRMAYTSLVGLFVVLFSMFAVNFFLTKFHVFVS